MKVVCKERDFDYSHRVVIDYCSRTTRLERDFDIGNLSNSIKGCCVEHQSNSCAFVVPLCRTMNKLRQDLQNLRHMRLPYVPLTRSEENLWKKRRSRELRLTMDEEWQIQQRLECLALQRESEASDEVLLLQAQRLANCATSRENVPAVFTCDSPPLYDRIRAWCRYTITGARRLIGTCSEIVVSIALIEMMDV